MSTATKTIEDLANTEYKYGFVTDVEQDIAPKGLNEDTIRLISLKKEEPEWLLEWRLKALRAWLKMREPHWHPNAHELNYLIKGRVQGVFYRANTQSKAIELGVTGWARNLPDGGVEVMAFGTEDQLKTLSDWLGKGPTLAKVTEIETKEVEWQRHPFFEIK
jgi:acylphosphatase